MITSTTKNKTSFFHAVVGKIAVYWSPILPRVRVRVRVRVRIRLS